jgi:hypothetical protein
MTRLIRIGVVVLFAVAFTGGVAQGQKPTATSTAAAAAAKANPELIGGLSKELGSTPEQAAGAAGSLFSLAKSRLKPEEFQQISTAVPGMTSLLGAAPAAPTGGAAGMAAAAGGLAGLGGTFSKLGLSPDLVAKAIPFLTQYVGKVGGPTVAKLLGGALR